MSIQQTHQQQVSDRAHFLWEQAGKPEGRDLEFWLQAESDLLGRKTPQTVAQTTQPKAAPFPELPARGTQPPRRAPRTGSARAR